MKVFMISQERSFILQLIQEIPDFKSWVLGCLKDSLETLVGHTDMHLFRFFVNSSSWLMMQYKVSPIDLVWSSIDGPQIRLWKANIDGLPKLPARVPSPYSILPNLGQLCIKFNGETKFYKFWIIQICGFLEVGHCAKFHIWNEDEDVCGVLWKCFVAFVKTVTISKYNSFGGLLAFQQLEV